MCQNGKTEPGLLEIETNTVNDGYSNVSKQWRDPQHNLSILEELWKINIKTIIDKQNIC